MKFSSFKFAAVLAAFFAAPFLISSARIAAQQKPNATPATPATPSSSTPQSGSTPATQSNGLPNAAPATPATVDPAEETDYKAFAAIPATDADKRITAGEAFVAKYPNSRYAGTVYSVLTQAEYSKQDVPKTEADGQKAIAANPDDLTALIIVGTIIPRAYDPNNPGAKEQLDQAEGYVKHALEVIPSLQKPVNLTDDQFNSVKSDASNQAHSALGLIYFRKQNVDGCVTELKSATDSGKNVDPTDFYVLGFCQKAKSDFTNAADSFGKCAAIPGGLAQRCKEAADDAKKQAGSAKPPVSK
jgi:tetratricopeptide (TPR) repeat protein